MTWPEVMLPSCIHTSRSCWCDGTVSALRYARHSTDDIKAPPMATRRDFIARAGTLALAAAASAAGAKRLNNGLRINRPHWSPYRDAMVIDGAGGIGLLWFEGDAAAVKKELAAIRDSGVSAIVLTIAPSGKFWMNDAAFEKTKTDIARWDAITARYPERLLIVRTQNDLQRAHRERKLGLIYTFQGAESLGEDIERIALFRALGVRVIQLTHNRRNLVGDGCMEPSNAGLSNYGRQVVERLNAEKIVVDLAHGSARTMAEGISASRQPALISHTGCRALADVPRNTDDAILRALADIIFWPYLRTDTQPMAIDVIRHIEHAVNVCGEDHVGIAPVERSPDYEKENREWIADAVEQGVFARGRPPDLYTFIPDLNTADRFDALAAMLSARGHSDARIEKVLGGNFARVMAAVWEG
jgi:membrane dipeptidase